MSIEFVVCSTPDQAVFDDDVAGVCEKCGKAIIWRPHAPEGKKICLACAVVVLKEIDEPPIFAVTGDSIVEVLRWAQEVSEAKKAPKH